MEAVSKGAGCDNKQGVGISRIPFDGLRTGFDMLLHYALRRALRQAQDVAQDAVPQLLRMLTTPQKWEVVLLQILKITFIVFE